MPGLGCEESVTLAVCFCFPQDPMDHVSRRRNALAFVSLPLWLLCYPAVDNRLSDTVFLTLRLFVQCPRSPWFCLTADLRSELLNSVGARGMIRDFRAGPGPVNSRASELNGLGHGLLENQLWEISSMADGPCGVSCRCRCRESWWEVHHDLRGAVPEVFEGCPCRWSVSSGMASYLSPPFGCTLMIWLNQTKQNEIWVALTTYMRHSYEYVHHTWSYDIK